MPRSVALSLLVLAAAVFGCTSSDDDPQELTTPTSEQIGEQPSDSPESGLDACGGYEVADMEPPTEVPSVDPASLIALSQSTFVCAESVTVVAGSAVELLPEAAELSLVLGGPLLALDGNNAALTNELSRLRPRVIHAFGEVPSEVFPKSAVVRRYRSGDSRDPELALAALGSPRRNPDATTAIVFSNADAVSGLLLLPNLRPRNTTVLVVNPDRNGDDVQPFTGEVLVGSELDPTTDWRIRLAASGTELPGGGTEMFPGRRLVALYGSPASFRLGVLGEQDVEESFARLRPLVSEYSTSDDIVVVPSFEIIVTVATGGPGDDGDFSQELAPDDVWPWVDFAAEHGVFVMLDLQPGRDDFLTQAKEYEELLREPHVGLALDPEWRLRPNERPLTRIGSVDAAEVNEVVEWLTEIVREEAIPQKPLVIHQFLRRMLPDREEILTPPELAVVIHVDGQGSLGAKYSTYTTMTTDDTGPDQILWWGWKNFYDEDTPVARADQVNDREPWPVVITFQ